MLPPGIVTFGTTGRNTFRNLRFRNADFSAVKNFRFGERLSMEFRAEFFNIFKLLNFANRWTFGPPGESVAGPGDFQAGLAALAGAQSGCTAPSQNREIIRRLK